MLPVYNKFGETLLLDVDVDGIAQSISKEVDSNQDLLWGLRSYIIETIQSLAATVTERPTVKYKRNKE